MTLTLVLALALSAGCATRTFEVDAIKSAEVTADGDAFRIVNGNPARSDADVLVQTAITHVKTALSAKGMFEAPEKVPANMVVDVDFGTKAPRKMTVRRRVPAETRAPEPAHYATETAYDKDGGSRTTMRYVPADSLATSDDWREVTETKIVYPKFLSITAREARARDGCRAPRELWNVTVTNEDTEESLETSLPLMVAAAMDAIDHNDPTPRKVKLREGDNRVTFVRRGL